MQSIIFKAEWVGFFLFKNKPSENRKTKENTHKHISISMYNK